jgi:peptidoglycan/LPS O-acetylase OafA/YrhL
MGDPRTTATGAPAKKPAPARLESLDGMRGVLSLLVALAHLQFYGNYRDSELLSGMYMMIDFFFVLSGYVIAQSSLDRLGSWREVYTFMIRRFGRVYPMHFLVLCAFVAMELIKLAASQSVATNNPPFHPPTYSVASLPANFLLLQSWNLFDAPTWNVPSWSISTEFYVYISFALGVFFLRQRLVYVAPVIIAAASSALYFNVEHGDATYQFGGLRCLSGFYCGYLLYLINQPTRERVRKSTPSYVFTLVELLTLFLAGWFMRAHGDDRWALLAPFIFTYVTWLFSFDGGLLSKVLSWKPLQVLGEISFTTYIIHDFVWAQLERVLRALERRFDLTLFVEHGVHDDGTPAQLFSIGSPTTMDLAACVALAGLTLLSLVISRRIEMPILKWFQDLARMTDKRAVRVPNARVPVTADR